MYANAMPARRLYFVNAPVDFFFIGGFSILLFFFLPLIGHSARTAQTAAVAAALSWVVNWPHFSATVYRLYHTSENTRQYPVTSWLVPPLVIAAVLWSFASPEHVAPLFVKVFLLWSPYHFSGQTLGITLLYARRAEFEIDRLQRALLEGFIFGTFLFSTARAETSTGKMTYYAMEVPFLGVPDWVPHALEIAMYVCIAAFIAITVYRCIQRRRLPPWIVLLPAATQFVWFVAGPRVPGFYEFVPFFHSLQYLLIAWAMQLKERLVESGARPSWNFASAETFIWGYTNFAGGVAMFWAFPHLAALLGLPFDVANPVIIAAFQIHHFFVDGVIWKLRNPKVGTSLMTSFDEFVIASGVRPIGLRA